MRGRATGVALPALVVLGLVAVVAVTATGSTPVRSRTSRPPSETLLDVFLTLGGLACLIGAAMLVYGLTQREAIARELATGRYRRGSLVAWLAFATLFAALTYWRLKNWKPSPADGSEDIVIGPKGERPTLPPGAETTYEPSFNWVAVAVVSVLVLAAGIAYVASRRRARPGRDAGGIVADELASALDEALDDLRSEADPRRAVIAAYARLERICAANGLPRRASETADEYLPHVLHDLALDPAAVARLTRLFTEAKFSHHRVDAAMKKEAIDALESVRDELRVVAATPGRPAPSPIAVTGT